MATFVGVTEVPAALVEAGYALVKAGYPCEPGFPQIREYKPLPENHPDRQGSFTNYDGNRITLPVFTHTLGIYYCERWGALYGVTDDGELWLWSD